MAVTWVLIIHIFNSCRRATCEYLGGLDLSGYFERKQIFHLKFPSCWITIWTEGIQQRHSVIVSSFKGNPIVREWNRVESTEWKNNAHHLQREITVRIVIACLKRTLPFFGSAYFKLDPQGWRRGGGGARERRGNRDRARLKVQEHQREKKGWIKFKREVTAREIIGGRGITEWRWKKRSVKGKRGRYGERKWVNPRSPTLCYFKVITGEEEEEEVTDWSKGDEGKRQEFPLFISYVCEGYIENKWRRFETLRKKYGWSFKRNNTALGRWEQR